MSLKTRSTHRSGIATTCEIEALSTPTNDHGREPVTWARISPITPPCATTITHWSTCAATMRSKAPRTRGAELLAGLGAGDHVPALLGEHLERHRVTVGHLLAEEAGLPLAEVHLAEVGLDLRRDPRRAARGAAVCTVRCRVLT